MAHVIRPDFGETRLDALQRHAFAYFLNETNAANGLVADRTDPGAPASIAAVGFALAAYPVGVERGWMTRTDAIERTLALLRFFWTSPQDTAPDVTGYKGFYYHFLDMTTGRRVGLCELSTVDTSFLLAGMLAAAGYFDQDSEAEREIRTLAHALYRRADWPWACDGGATVTHGWKPESGFLPYRWEGYDEAMLLYALGLGSPTYPLPTESYAAWTSSYQWKQIYGYELLYGGSLFIHQYSHVFVDFRGIQDAFARDKGIDYCENSRRATCVQQAYAIRNPLEFAGYGEYFWGLTASDGPGWTTQRVRGIERTFFDYVARGGPYGPDDGTVAPWAAVASPVRRDGTAAGGIFERLAITAGEDRLVTDMSRALQKICLVRHGETAWTISGQHTGRTDIELTERGERDAQQMSARLRGMTFANVLTSPLRRARRTGELAGFGAYAEADADLMEWDYGAYEGRRTADILAERQGWRLFEDGCPGGETVDAVGARADRVIARVRARAGDVLLFAHRDIFRVLAARWLGLAAREGRYFYLATASLSVLGYHHDLDEPVIHLWNDARD